MAWAGTYSKLKEPEVLKIPDMNKELTLFLLGFQIFFLRIHLQDMYQRSLLIQLEATKVHFGPEPRV